MISTNEWSILNRWMNYDEECCEISVIQFMMMKMLKLNECWNKCCDEVCDEISVTQFVAKVCWKFVESMWCMMDESLLKNHSQILMNVVKWMLWSECEICSSYIFHNLREYVIDHLSKMFVTIIVEWNFVTIIVEWNFANRICVCIIKCLSKNVTHLLSWRFMIKNHDALLKCLCWMICYSLL